MEINDNIVILNAQEYLYFYLLKLTLQEVLERAKKESKDDLYKETYKLYSTLVSFSANHVLYKK